ncbi:MULTISPECIES: hypothetical protein [Pandoraea]|jgi:hypothetical protein|nr:MULTISPECIES: hypothetical protein [Pandoraea]
MKRHRHGPSGSPCHHNVKESTMRYVPGLFPKAIAGLIAGFLRIRPL